MTGTTLLQSPVFQRLGGTLARFLWQGSVIAALLASANVLLARRRAELRYAASCAALLLMLGWTGTTFLRWRPEPPSADGASSREAAVAASVPAPSPAASLRVSFLSTAASRLAARASTLEPWLVTAWLAGVMLLSLRFLFDWRRAQALLTRTLPAPPAFDRALARLARRLRVSRPIRLFQSAAVRVPIAIGSLRPVILLPVAAATGLPAEELEAILAHELAHIRRHDYFVNLLQTLAETLLFYHPAVWWVSRQIRVERENCCDDLAIEATGDPRVYARALFGLERMRGGVAEPAVAASGGLLWRRIARLFPE
ncbi:MAG: M56 family metallopeptidase, partial [Acidobacteriota bacterium]